MRSVKLVVLFSIILVTLSCGFIAAQSLPNAYKPITGYTWNGNDGKLRIGLWDANGEYYLFDMNYNNWTNIVPDGASILPGQTGPKLPSGFKAILGYTWVAPSNGATKISLWNSNGENYVYDSDSGEWTNANLQRGQPGKLPLGYNPIVGYTWKVSDGSVRVSLWNISGVNYAWSSVTNVWTNNYNATSPQSPDSGKLPAEVYPEAGYSWIGSDGNARVAVWDSNSPNPDDIKQYLWNSQDKWSSGYHSILQDNARGKLPPAFRVRVGYSWVAPDSSTRIVLWDVNGINYRWSNNTGIWAGPFGGDIYEINKCMNITQPGNYWISDDMYIAGSSSVETYCITVKTSNVTIDGSGKKLRIRNLQTNNNWHFMNISGVRNVTIKNLNIVDEVFRSRAIHIIKSENVSIIDSKIKNFWVGIASFTYSNYTNITNTNVCGYPSETAGYFCTNGRAVGATGFNNRFFTDKIYYGCNPSTWPVLNVNYKECIIPGSTVSLTECMIIDTPGTYNLANDITYTGTGACIDIRESNVIINGNGKNITGANKQGVGIIINDVGLSGIVIDGIGINNFGKGIDIYNGDAKITVRNSNIYNNNYGVYVDSANNYYGQLNLNNNQIRQNTIKGVFIPILIFQATISNNVICNNAFSDFDCGLLVQASGSGNNMTNIVSCPTSNWPVLGTNYNLCSGTTQVCNNNGIKEGSEACDGSDFGIIGGGNSCSDYNPQAYSSGSLSCSNSCSVITSACVPRTGGTEYFLCSQLSASDCGSYMNDYILQNIQNHNTYITDGAFCFDRDVTYEDDPNDNSCGTYLACNCVWDSSASVCKERVQRVGESNPSCTTPQTQDLCYVTTSTSGSCSEDGGEYILSWTAEAAPGGNLEAGGCYSGSKAFPCPTRTDLPFFGVFNFIVSVLLVVVIYSIYLRRKYFILA